MGEIPGHYQDRRADFWPSLTFSVGTARIKIRPEHTNHAAVGAPSKQRGQETEPGPSFSKESISRRVLRGSQEVPLRGTQGPSREISQIAINAHFRHYPVPPPRISLLGPAPPRQKARSPKSAFTPALSFFPPPWSGSISLPT